MPLYRQLDILWGTATSNASSNGKYQEVKTLNTDYLEVDTYKGQSVWADVGGIKYFIGNVVTEHVDTPILDEIRYKIPTVTEVVGPSSADGL